MYPIKSNNTADLSQYLVVFDLIELGWIVSFPSSRDSSYDLIVENRTSAGNRKLETIQIKTLKGNQFTTSNRGRCSGREETTIGGNIRYNYSYADAGIDCMAGVDLPDNQVYYYPHRIYKHHDKINVKKVPNTPFKQNTFMVNQRPR